MLKDLFSDLFEPEKPRVKAVQPRQMVSEWSAEAKDGRVIFTTPHQKYSISAETAYKLAKLLVDKARAT